MRPLLTALLCILCLLAPRPGRATASYVQWGKQMLQQKKYDEAIRYFGAAARADQHDAAAYKGLGYAFAYKNERTKALEYLNYALKLNPGDAALAAYVEQLKGSPAAPAKAESAQAAAPGEAPADGEIVPATSPWIMGGTVALLGTLMLLVF